jgi:peptidyl-prolyl cis-trans isomerase A (cyclophilin A)
MTRFALLILVLLWTACSSSDSTPPDQFHVKFETSKGTFTVVVNRPWSPLGADQFYRLVKSGYYDGNRFFRVLPGFVVQWGINGDPAVTASHSGTPLADDPPGQSNTAGTVVFATAGPNSRTTQVFINLANNPNLDTMGFTPFGRVTEGMEVVRELYPGYGEGAPQGNGPNQMMLRTQGNAYLEREFPKLDFIKKASVSD